MTYDNDAYKVTIKRPDLFTDDGYHFTTDIFTIIESFGSERLMTILHNMYYNSQYDRYDEANREALLSDIATEELATNDYSSKLTLQWVKEKIEERLT